MDDALDSLSQMPGMAADLDPTPGPFEDYDQADRRVAQATQAQRSATAQYGRVKAADFSSRNIPFVTKPDGDTTPITDWTGAALTSADPTNKVAYDSTGNPVDYSRKDPKTGAPVVKDAFDGVPITTEKKTGDQYRIRAGLPWKYEGQDADTVAQLQQAKEQSLNQQTNAALAAPEAQAAKLVRNMAGQAKLSTKNTGNTLTALGVLLTDATGNAIDLSDTDAPTLKQHIDTSFNQLYAAPEANEKPIFGGGEYSKSATALRTDLDNRKQQAMQVADTHVGVLGQYQQAHDALDQISQTRASLAADKLSAVNKKRVAAGLAPVTIPGMESTATPAMLNEAPQSHPQIPGLAPEPLAAAAPQNQPITGASNVLWRTGLTAANSFEKGIEGIIQLSSKVPMLSPVGWLLSKTGVSDYLRKRTAEQEAALRGEPVKDTGETLAPTTPGGNLTANVAGGLIGNAPGIALGGIPGLIALGTQAMGESAARAHDDAVQQGMSEDDATHAAGIAALKTLPQTALYAFTGKATGTILSKIVPLAASPLSRAAAALVAGTAANLTAGATGKAIVGENPTPTVSDVVNSIVFAAHGASTEHQTAKDIATAQSIINGSHPEMAVMDGIAEGKVGNATPAQQASAAQYSNALRAVARDYIEKQGYKAPESKTSTEPPPIPTEKSVSGKVVEPDEATPPPESAKTPKGTSEPAATPASTSEPSTATPEGQEAPPSKAEPLSEAGSSETGSTEQQKAPAKIEGPALADENGNILAKGKIGQTHADIRMEAAKNDVDATEATHAFHDGSDKPLSRTEAADRALATGQIDQATYDQAMARKEPGLKSQDLKPEAVDNAAHTAATSPFSEHPAPTDAQKAAGNHAMGHTKIGPLDVTIEHPEGTRRKPEWNPLTAHYGYVRGSASGDKEQIDAFIKPGTPTNYDGPVYVVNKHRTDTGAVDHKAILGANSPDEALAIHNANYPEGLHAEPSDVATFSTPKAFHEWATGASRRSAPARGDVTPEPPVAEKGAGVVGAAPAPEASPEAKSALQLARAALKLHASTLDKLEHPKDFEIGKTRAASGIETDTQTHRIRIDPEKVASVTDGWDKKKQEKWIKRVVAHEVIHVATLKYADESEANKANLLALTGDKELMRRAGEAYGPEWEGLSDFAKAAEAARMLIEGPEELTESSYKFLKDFLDWLKDKLANLSGAAKDVVDGIRAKMGRYEKAQEPTKENAPPKQNPTKAATKPIVKAEAPKLTAAEQAAKDAAGDLFGAAKPDADPFYSQLTRTLEGLPQESMTIAQAKAAIEKGSKADEQKMSGILTDPISPLFGRGPNDKVSKSDLVGYALERQAKVQDVTLGGNSDARKKRLMELNNRPWANDLVPKAMEAGMSQLDAANLPGRLSDGRITVDSLPDSLRESARQFLSDVTEREELAKAGNGGATHFSQYQLPGADEGSYREHFVTWPRNEGEPLRYTIRPVENNPLQKDWWEIVDQNGEVRTASPNKEYVFKQIREWEGMDVRGKADGNWSDGHSQFSDISNPIVRIRRNIRTDADGKRTYFIEEMQGPGKSEQAKMPPELQKRIYEIGMKRALRDAADEGADKIAWTRGETQAERYDLSKQVNRVDAKKYDRDRYQIAVLDKNDTEVNLPKEAFTASELDDVVGKELAAKIVTDLEHASPTLVKNYKGLDLKIGGEGLKRLYDSTLPRIANELAKKFGVKVGTSAISTGTGNNFEKWFKNNYGNPSHHSESFIDSARLEYQELNPAQKSGATVHSLSIPKGLAARMREGNPLFAAKPEQTFDAKIPPEKRPAMVSAFMALSTEANTPEKFAASLLKLGPKAPQFSQQLWFIAKGGYADGSDRPDWAKIYDQLQQPEARPELGENKSISGMVEGTKVKLGKSPQLHTVIEQLPPAKGDLPDESYFRVKNDRTGETQVVESRDLKPVQARSDAEKEADKAKKEATLGELEKRLKSAGLDASSLPDVKSKKAALRRKEALGAASPMRADNEQQARWMTRQAQARGFESIGELSESDDKAFQSLAKQWRAFHHRHGGNYLNDEASRGINKVLYDPSKPAGTSQDALADAADHIRAVREAVGARGTGAGTEPEADSGPAERDALVALAKRRGMLLDKLPKRFTGLNIGGGEHDVYLDPGTQRVVKITSSTGESMGYYPAVTKDGGIAFTKGSPSQYLDGLKLRNEVFGDDNRLHAIFQHGENVHAVTSQPHVTGEKPTTYEIDAAMSAAGFSKMDDATFYRKRDNVAVFDLKPDNAFRVGDALVPIDGIVIHPSEEMIDALKDAQLTHLAGRENVISPASEAVSALGAAHPEPNDPDKATSGSPEEPADKSLQTSQPQNPSLGGASEEDTGKPEDGKTASERLIRQADAAGLSYSMETLKGMIRGDQAIMEKMRARIRAEGQQPLGAANPLRAAYDKAAETVQSAKDEIKSTGVRDKIVAGFDAGSTLANYRGNQAAASIRLDLPEAKDREAMPFVIEAGGNRAKLVAEKAKVLASTDPKLAAKYAPVVQHAIDQFDRLNATRTNHDQIMAANLAKLQVAGVDVGEVEDYVTRKLDEPENVRAILPNPLFKMGGGTGSNPRYFTKGRAFETLADAIKAGYRPKGTDLADLDGHRIAAGEKILEQRKYIDNLKATPAPTDGKPVIGQMQTRQTLSGPEQTVPWGYSVVNVMGRPLVVHNQFSDTFKNLFGHSAIRSNVIGRALMKFAATAKAGTLVFDTFHVGRLLFKQANAGGGLPVTGRAGKPAWNIHKGLSLLEYSDADLARAVQQRLVTPQEAAYARRNRPMAEELMKAGLNVGRVSDNLMEQAGMHLPIIGKLNDWIFQKLSRGAMIQTSLEAFERNLKKPGITREEAARQTAKEMNEYFGNMQNQGLFTNKTLQDVARLVFLAPQWTESQARYEGRAYAQAAKSAYRFARTGGKERFVGNSTRAMVAGFVALLAVNQLLNYLSRGKSTFQNPEEGHKLDAWVPGGKRGFWFDPAEIAAEYFHAAEKYFAQHENPVDIASHIASNKMSPLARGTKEALTGRDYAGRHFLSNADRFRAAIVDALPSPLPFGAFFEKDPRKPIGYRVSRQTGSIEKQLLQSAGAKVTAAQSPRTQMFALAQPYRADRGGNDAAGEYTELRRALDNDNRDATRTEVQWLLTRGKNMPQIEHAVGWQKGGTIKPEMFAGGEEREADMLSHLTTEQKDIYRQAQTDHIANALKFKQYTQTLQPVQRQQPQLDTKLNPKRMFAGF